ncbi:MAG: hypothetical protein ACXVHV_06465 [Methanobacterium sp.]
MEDDKSDGFYVNPDDLKNQRGNNNRYLVCNRCSGYYKLKDNEYPEDFIECECGGSLSYYQDIEIDDIFQYPNSNYVKTDDKSSKNKFNTHHHGKNEKILRKLYGNIKEQEMALNDIKHEKIIGITNDDWSIWNRLERDEARKNPDDQKMIDNEIKKQETQLLLQVKNKRKDNSFNLRDLLR